MQTWTVVFGVDEKPSNPAGKLGRKTDRLFNEKLPNPSEKLRRKTKQEID